ncbi:MAG: hypothetical protein D6751_09130 [Deltaproteobacteria bacterium]|nr:MAG: hypothetical protein D6751_09130 [Deltaproteobacteria bacterium]
MVDAWGASVAMVGPDKIQLIENERLFVGPLSIFYQWQGRQARDGSKERTCFAGGGMAREVGYGQRCVKKMAIGGAAPGLVRSGQGSFRAAWYNFVMFATD